MSLTSKKILITFGRSYWALDLCRQLSEQGHDVSIADSVYYPVSRFSKHANQYFKVPSPRFNQKGYVKALIEIVEKEKIDLLIPVFEEIFVLSSHLDEFPKSCHLFCPPFDLYHSLHNKWLFHQKQESLGIKCPKAFLVRKKEEIEHLDFTTPFALKPTYSRAQSIVKKAYPGESLKDLVIENSNPWIAQEWIEGSRFCTYTICHHGKIHAHSVYPVEYAINGNSCLTFKETKHPKIYKWIEHFVKQVNFSGQVAFDFIESKEGVVQAIECNPRATSGLHLFDASNNLGSAFLGENTSPIFPTANTKRQLATGMLLFGWKKSALPNQNFKQFFKDLCKTKDVLFSFKDLKPLLFEPLIFAEIIANCFKYKKSIPAAFTYDHDWNG